MLKCVQCNGDRIRKYGFMKGKQRYKCNDCYRSWYECDRRPQKWSPEEDMLLIVIGQAPNLRTYWNEHAKQVGWPTRTLGALRARLRVLGEARSADEASGWVTPVMLITSLGLSDNNCSSFASWRAAGLPADKSEGGLYRVFLGDFVRWLLTPIGMEKIVRSIRGNTIAMRWILQTIADWKDEPNPVQKPKKRGRSQKVA